MFEISLNLHSSFPQLHALLVMGEYSDWSEGQLPAV